MVSFETTKADADLIRRIIDRACREQLVQGGLQAWGSVDLSMDITAVHVNDSPLDLEQLLNAPAGDFGHDVLGIRRHLDRISGKLKNCFSPRCTLPAAKREDDLDDGGKARPVEPGTFPLAHGAPARVGRLRGYGNALVAPQAEAFIRAYLEVRGERVA